MVNVTMTPEEIQGDYKCAITVEDYRVNKKAEYKVVVRLSFYSLRSHSQAATSWHIWRSFSAFRKLDEQLRKRNTAHLKGIKFPPLYRRKSFFRANRSAEFMEQRMGELDSYLQMVTKSPQLVAFHIGSIQSQTLKSFIGFGNGFGSNPHYDDPNSQLRPSQSRFSMTPMSEASSDTMGVGMNGFGMRISGMNPDFFGQATESVRGDDDDDFRSVASSSTMSSFASPASAVPGDDYRWSGTGFVGTNHYVRGGNNTASMGMSGMNPFGNTRGSMASSRGSMMSRGSWAPATASIVERGTIGNGSNMRPSIGVARESMMAITPSDVITPEIDMQRAKMEEHLLKFNLMGVGMPPDGSCLLHCIVYEMYPLQCLQDYPKEMTVVNVGAADGVAPRRVAAAQLLRVRVAEYALRFVDSFAELLLQEPEDLRERYELFRDSFDEQATVAELYAIASMFNVQIILIANDESFHIDPVMPIEGLPSVREGDTRTITLGYLIPADGLAGHYICTRPRQSRVGGPVNSFAGGSYRGSINIGPPKPRPMAGGRCAPAPRRTERIPAQQSVE